MVGICGDGNILPGYVKKFSMLFHKPILFKQFGLVTRGSVWYVGGQGFDSRTLSTVHLP